MLNSIMFALNLIYREAIIPLFTISIAHHLSLKISKTSVAVCKISIPVLAFSTVFIARSFAKFGLMFFK